MRTFRLPLALCLTLVMSAAESTGSVAGKWTGTIDVHDESSGSTVSTPVQVQLEEQAGAVSGKIGREGETDVVPIRNAKLDNNQLDFEAVSGETSGPMKFHLIITGDSMEGEMRGAVDTADIVGKVKMSRQKN